MSSPRHVEQTVQAQILLATYLLRNNSLHQAEFHCGGAATLAVRYQFHKIRTARPSLSNIPGLSPTSPPPPGDAVEEGERIRAFWAVIFLQTGLCLTFSDTCRSTCILGSFGSEIDCPWPLEIADYHAGVFPPDYLGQQSIKHLLMDDSFPPSPICMLQTKAVILLYQSYNILSSAETAAECSWLDKRVSLLCQSLPPLHSFSNADPAVARSLAISHGLAAAAVIKVSQKVGVSAQAKCIAAARSILEYLRPSEGPTVHPIVGTLCALACDVLMAEIRNLRVFRMTWSTGRGTPMVRPTTEEDDMVNSVCDGLKTMGVYAGQSSLIAHQFKLAQEHYAAM
ncbi:hypothetical protein K438DRAFT_2022784 [Mycena galopus ATCC 62051]|nr:hypothetical protein K438DRAFT_2022784 [Mycena galopus ATCC 62051]